MKKLLLVGVGILFLIGIVKADENGGSMGGFGGSKFWRSSDTLSNDAWVKIATGNVVIGYVQISSPGVNSTISFLQTNTTAQEAWQFPAFFGSTFPTNGSDQGFTTTKDIQTNMIYVMKESTAGWAYKTTGSAPANLRILWDYKIYPQ